MGNWPGLWLSLFWASLRTDRRRSIPFLFSRALLHNECVSHATCLVQGAGATFSLLELQLEGRRRADRRRRTDALQAKFPTGLRKLCRPQLMKVSCRGDTSRQGLDPNAGRTSTEQDGGPPAQLARLSLRCPSAAQTSK